MENTAVPQNLSPLELALNTHGEELGKFDELIASLEKRLEKARCRSTMADGGLKEPLAEPVNSQLTGQVNMQTVTVRKLEARLLALLDELEV